MMNITCPKCSNKESIIKYGKTGPHQRFKCCKCGKTFINSNSPLKHLQVNKQKFKKFIGLMIDDVALDVIARNLKFDVKTIHYYRYIVFHALNNYQNNVIISGDILIDETFLRIQEKQHKIVRPDGKGIRGISFNQLCIITLINTQGIALAKVSSRGMAQPDDYKKLFDHNIGFVNSFIHDGNTKTYQFMNQYKANAINARKDTSEIYSTIMIDSLHSNLKRYLFKHAGYRMKNIQHYLNFFIYRTNFLASHNYKTKKQKLEIKNKMIEDLLLKVENQTKKITYKDFLSDEGITYILNYIRNR